MRAIAVIRKTEKIQCSILFVATPPSGPRTKLKGVRGGESPPKMVVKCTLAGQSAGQRTIGELLLLEKGRRQKCIVGKPLTPPKNLGRLRP